MLIAGFLSTLLRQHELSHNALRLLLALLNDRYLAERNRFELSAPLRREHLASGFGVDVDEIDLMLSELIESKLIRLNDDATYSIALAHFKGDGAMLYVSAKSASSEHSHKTEQKVAEKSDESEHNRDALISLNNQDIQERERASRNTAESQDFAATSPEQLIEAGIIQQGLSKPLKDDQESAAEITERMIAGWDNELTQKAMRVYIAKLHASRVHGKARDSKVLTLVRQYNELYLQFGADATRYAITESMKASAENKTYARRCAKTYTTKQLKRGERAKINTVDEVLESKSSYAGRV